MEAKEKAKFYFGIIVAILAFTIIAVGFVVVFVRYRKGLLQKQQQLFRQDFLHKQELLAINIESAEAERINIAKDIHDEIGSIFSTLSLSINQLKPGTVIEPEVFNSSNKLIEMGISSVRRIARSLAPFELELLGLKQALESHFETLTELSNLAINFHCSDDLERLKPTAELAIYRIMQELTSNCIKYAQADKVDISIVKKEDAIFITYCDDGAGSDLLLNSKKKGIGLKNIESRVLILDGTVQFVSSIGTGFKCNISIPYSKNILHD